jgi:hypothetical protein
MWVYLRVFAWSIYVECECLVFGCSIYAESEYLGAVFTRRVSICVECKYLPCSAVSKGSLYSSAPLMTHLFTCSLHLFTCSLHLFTCIPLQSALASASASLQHLYSISTVQYSQSYSTSTGFQCRFAGQSCCCLA